MLSNSTSHAFKMTQFMLSQNDTVHSFMKRFKSGYHAKHALMQYHAKDTW